MLPGAFFAAREAPFGPSHTHRRSTRPPSPCTAPAHVLIGQAHALPPQDSTSKDSLSQAPSGASSSEKLKISEKLEAVPPPTCTGSGPPDTFEKFFTNLSHVLPGAVPPGKNDWGGCISLDVLLDAMEDMLNDLMVWVITEVSKNRTAADSSYCMHAWNATYTWLKAGVKYLENTAQAALKNSESTDANYLGAIAGSSVCVASVTGKELNTRQRYVNNEHPGRMPSRNKAALTLVCKRRAMQERTCSISSLALTLRCWIVWWKSKCPSLLEKKGYEGMMFSGCSAFPILQRRRLW